MLIKHCGSSILCRESNISVEGTMLEREAPLIAQKLGISYPGCQRFFLKVSGVGHVSIVTRAKILWSRAPFL